MELERSYHCYRMNDVFKMCADRSSYYCTSGFTMELERSYHCYRMNDV